jgi:hypothetical protein
VEVSSSPQYFFVFVVFEFSPDTLDRAEEDPNGWRGQEMTQ